MGTCVICTGQPENAVLEAMMILKVIERILYVIMGYILCLALTRAPEPVTKTTGHVVTRTHIVHDTVTISSPRLVFATMTDTLYVPADTIFVREHKVYSDSTYTASVSGYDCRLDSISVFPKTVYITTDRTIENTVTRYKYRKWNLGVSAGYGITPKGLNPYIGLAITYNPFVKK